ncbi:hypothetical protein [Spirochaeta cellobiosiphila]|uniref:hypothetical protein n=1 Tax=Spirochaeta cellobiosiphila TaxID=504483 RepID=UPI00041CE123|nr:hypothetical protein [Spirochaeta cellobiosiphila]
MCPYPIKEYISLNRAEKYMELLNDLDINITIEKDKDIEGPYNLRLIHSGKIRHLTKLLENFFLFFDFTKDKTQNYLNSIPCTIKENLSLKRVKHYIELFEIIKPDFRPQFEIIKNDKSPYTKV